MAKAQIVWVVVDRDAGREPIVEARIVSAGHIKFTIPYSLEELREERAELDGSLEELLSKSAEEREKAKPKTPKPAPPVDPTGVPLTPKSEASQVLSALEDAAKADATGEPPKA